MGDSGGALDTSALSQRASTVIGQLRMRVPLMGEMVEISKVKRLNQIP